MFRGGGVQEIVLAMQEELIKRGHYVKIISPRPLDYDGEIPDNMIALGGAVSTKAFAGSAWQWAVSVDTDAVDAMFKQERFDVVHFHEPWVPVWSRQLVMKSPAANIGTMHGRFVDTITAKTINTTFIPYTKPMIKYFDAFTAASEAATEYFKSLSKRPITIVPNGIDLKKFQDCPSAAKSHPKRKTIFYVGRLEHRKGVKYLLMAFNELAKRRHDVQLLIAGSGVDNQKLHDYAEEEAIPRVKFLGYVTESEKLHLLHSADVFCSPALYGESFGVVLLEAMATRCPIVAGDNVGYQTTMKSTGAISLVNPKDTIDFSRRLELMLFDDSLRELWLKWSDEYVKQFDYPKIVDQYLDVYEQAMKHHEARKS
jgi:phosphatidylinositol alpha-mannosyltransferase